ncbi:MAG: response regulator [Balneolales bacterium]|nr:response regulator [Balneolales bacterium]
MVLFENETANIEYKRKGKSPLQESDKDLSPQISDWGNRKIKILIVEDVVLNIMLLKVILSKLVPDAEITEAKNGAEAVEKYVSTNPDIVFMDVHMPVLDGLEATRQIRAIEAVMGRRVPIIAVTAGVLKEDRDCCFTAGMDEFISKPIVTDKIKAVLRNYGLIPAEKGSIEENESEESEGHFRYSELAKDLENKQGAIRQLISETLADLPVKIHQLEFAYREMDTDTICFAAHSIEGAALSMRLPKLAALASFIKENASDAHKDIGTLHRKFAELKREWETVKQLLLQKYKRLVV